MRRFKAALFDGDITLRTAAHCPEGALFKLQQMMLDALDSALVEEVGEGRDVQDQPVSRMTPTIKAKEFRLNVKRKARRVSAKRARARAEAEQNALHTARASQLFDYAMSPDLTEAQSAELAGATDETAAKAFAAAMGQTDPQARHAATRWAERLAMAALGNAKAPGGPQGRAAVDESAMATAETAE